MSKEGKIPERFVYFDKLQNFNAEKANKAMAYKAEWNRNKIKNYSKNEDMRFKLQD